MAVQSRSVATNRSATDHAPALQRDTQAALISMTRLLTALGGGLVLFAAFPPRELWWLAAVAFVLLGAAVRGARARMGLGCGLLFGLGYYLPLLPWVGEFVGPIPWLALAVVAAVFPALSGAGMATVSRLPTAPVWGTGMWVAGEALGARVPFGGFPWGRVAFSQPDGAFLPLAAVGGTPLLGAAVVLTGLATAELIVVASRRARWQTAAVPALLAVGPVLAGLAATPLVDTAAEAGTVSVAAIQGNVPRPGLDFNAERRAVLDNHVARTEQLVDDVAAGREPQPDVVIWPENSSDIDPLRNPDARTRIDAAARAIDAPILVGSVLQRDDGTATNTMLAWEPGAGPTDRHDKRRLQPFGEYMPARDFFRLLSPYADLAGNFVPGDGDGAVDLGAIRVGVATCYEVIFDDAVRESVRSGAQLLAVPSNNATFGFTDMTYQQMAIDRVRAVEHGRAVVVATTSGSSAVIRPDGSVVDSTELFVPAALVEQVPLRTSLTLATRIGGPLEWVLVAFAGAGLVAAAGLRVRSSRR
jgi:apolipoprotein N-acyltransferase